MDFIKGYMQRHSRAPTRETIATALGSVARQTIAHYVKSLEAKGYVERQRKGPKRIRIVKEPDVAVFATWKEDRFIVGRITTVVADEFATRPDFFMVEGNGQQSCLLAVHTGEEIRPGKLVVARIRKRMTRATCREVCHRTVELGFTGENGKEEIVRINLDENRSTIEGVVVGKLIAMQNDRDLPRAQGMETRSGTHRPRPRPPLTKGEAATLDFFHTHMDRNNRPPTRKRAALGRGISAKQVIDNFLKRLETKGYVETGRYGRRDVRILLKPDVPLFHAAHRLQPGEPLQSNERMLGRIPRTVVDGFAREPTIFVLDDSERPVCLLAVRTGEKVEKGTRLIARKGCEVVCGTCCQIRDGSAEIAIANDDGTEQRMWVATNEENSPVEGEVIGKVMIVQQENS